MLIGQCVRFFWVGKKTSRAGDCRGRQGNINVIGWPVRHFCTNAVLVLTDLQKAQTANMILPRAIALVGRSERLAFVFFCALAILLLKRKLKTFGV